MDAVVRGIVEGRELVGKYLAPSTGRLATRAACHEYGPVDKYGANNIHADGGSTVSFECPRHAPYHIITRSHLL